MKKIIIFIIMFFLTSCYNYVEINDLLIIDGIKIDYKDNMYNISFEGNKIYNSKGKSLGDAFYDFEQKIEKKPFYAHLKVLLISKEVLNKHFEDVIYFFLRNNDIRNNFYLITYSDSSNSVFSKNSSKNIRSIITNNKDKRNILSSSLFKNIITDYLDKKTLHIPLIEKDEDNNYKISKAIIKDTSKVVTLDENETNILNIIKSKNPSIIYSGINIYKSNVKYHIYDKSFVLDINLDAELKDENNININKKLKKDIENLFNKMQKENIDVLNINHKYYTKTKKKNSNYFKDVKIIINLNIDINRKGQILKGK